MESRSTCNHDLRFENLSRRELLSRLTPGDIVHGIAANGAILLCLVVALDETSILTRRITTQEPYRFDPITGVAISDDGQTQGRIT